MVQSKLVIHTPLLWKFHYLVFWKLKCMTIFCYFWDIFALFPSFQIVAFFTKKGFLSKTTWWANFVWLYMNLKSNSYPPHSILRCKKLSSIKSLELNSLLFSLINGKWDANFQKFQRFNISSVMSWQPAYYSTCVIRGQISKGA